MRPGLPCGDLLVLRRREEPGRRLLASRRRGLSRRVAPHGVATTPCLAGSGRASWLRTRARAWRSSFRSSSREASSCSVLTFSSSAQLQLTSRCFAQAPGSDPRALDARLDVDLQSLQKGAPRVPESSSHRLKWSPPPHCSSSAFFSGASSASSSCRGERLSSKGSRKAGFRLGNFNCERAQKKRRPDDDALLSYRGGVAGGRAEQLAAAAVWATVLFVVGGAQDVKGRATTKRGPRARHSSGNNCCR